jgi:hypothetical protein
MAVGLVEHNLLAVAAGIHLGIQEARGPSIKEDRVLLPMQVVVVVDGTVAVEAVTIKARVEAVQVM